MLCWRIMHVIFLSSCIEFVPGAFMIVGLTVLWETGTFKLNYTEACTSHSGRWGIRENSYSNFKRFFIGVKAMLDKSSLDIHQYLALTWTSGHLSVIDPNWTPNQSLTCVPTRWRHSWLFNPTAFLYFLFSTCYHHVHFSVKLWVGLRT